MITTIKTCFKCNTEKPLDDFYKHSQMAVAANYSQSNITQLPVYDRQTEIKLLYWF